MKKKRNYDITHKVMRVRAGDYAFLAEVSRKADIPMAEALHLVIEQQGQVIKVSSAQPAFQVTGMPAFRVTGMPVLRVTPATVTAVNGAGAKHSAFVIKPKGGVIHE